MKVWYNFFIEAICNEIKLTAANIIQVDKTTIVSIHYRRNLTTKSASTKVTLKIREIHIKVIVMLS